MNIRDDIKQLKTGDQDLRKFGMMVGGVFAVLGLLLLLRHKPLGVYFVLPGTLLIVFGAALPRALKYVYLAWMSLAFVLGFVMAHVILIAFFYLIIAPIGLVARLAGKDFLSLKLNRQGKSYWIRRATSAHAAADYERQF